MINEHRLRKQLVRHEGMELKPYTDTVGKTTIGVGRNLDDVGITEAEALLLLGNDIAQCVEEARNSLPGFVGLNSPRKEVLVNMLFNLGLPRLLRFKKMLQAVAWGDYEEAADQMLNSRWAGQVGDRAVELAEIMRKGHYEP